MYSIEKYAIILSFFFFRKINIFCITSCKPPAMDSYSLLEANK